MSELQTLATTAFRANQLEQAEAFFLAFERDFGAEPQVKDAVDRQKALIALCMIGNGRAAQAKPYAEAALLLPPGIVGVDVRQELSFWLAIVRMQEGDYRAAQEAFGKFFAVPEFQPAKRMEALVLFGTCYVTLGYHRTAAEFFFHQIPNLRRIPGGQEYAGRAVVLRLMALLNSGQHDAALILLREEYPRMAEISQVIAFQTLALQLGSKFLEEKRYHDAIACLQRIWTQSRLLKHQEERLVALKKRQANLAQDPLRASALFQLNGMIQRVEREVENFRQIEEFDAALRFRLALSFQGLARYREAALIMEDMLRHLEPSPVVQSASLAVIQSWMQLERWPKALEAAENYLVAFGDQKSSPDLAQAMFLQADALQKLERTAESNSVFANIASLFPKHPLRPKAIFMQGFTNLLLETNDSAATNFEQLVREYPEDAVAQDASYWKAMALSFKQDYPACRQLMESYLKAYAKTGIRYESEAHFRMAYCTFCSADYETAIREFSQFLKEYGDHAPDADEARLLLGDAYLALGQAEKGLAAYRSIHPASTRFFEDGWFKTGNALKLLEDIPAMRAHFEEFLQKYPSSQRMPEAVYWIGYTLAKEGRLEDAKRVYWDTLDTHGDNPALFSVEDLLTGVPKVYRKEGSDGSQRLRQDLQRRQGEAKAAKKNTLQVRLLWLEAIQLRSENATLSDGLLASMASQLNPEVHNPLLLADAADAARRKGHPVIAEKLYKELKRWNPRSLEGSRADAGLGYLAAAAGKHSEAIRYFTEYERKAATSLDLPEILLVKADLQEREKQARLAEATYEQVLSLPNASGHQKARALLGLGDHFARNQEGEKAAAYYERVYVAYGRFLDLVAPAYLRRAQTLESLDRKPAAWQVYQELATRPDLSEFAEANQARHRAEALSEFAHPPQAATPVAP